MSTCSVWSLDLSLFGKRIADGGELVVNIKRSRLPSVDFRV